jgi:predicted amidohydrolase
VGQLTSTASMAHNLNLCRILVQKAKAAKASCLFLPEASDYIGSSPEETISLARSIDKSPFVLGLQEEAKKNEISINVGIHEPTEAGKKVKNTSIWIDEKGVVTQRYQKLHLFDIDIPGKTTLKESNSVEKGMSILPPFETAIGKVGLTICFDVRFLQLYLLFLSRSNKNSYDSLR